MAVSDRVSETLVRWMDKAFNDEKVPPVGGLSGGCQLRPGVSLPALDNFEECSLAWVMAGLRFNTTQFPTPAETTKCSSRPVLEFTVGIARCSRALGEDGSLPSLEEMEQEFAAQEDDKDRLWKATCVAMRELRDNGLALS